MGVCAPRFAASAHTDAADRNAVGHQQLLLMFRDVYALYGSNPPARLYMLQHFMNGNFYQLNHQLLSAAALATVLLITGTVWFGKRCTVEKRKTGKGGGNNVEKRRAVSPAKAGAEPFGGVLPTAGDLSAGKFSLRWRNRQLDTV